MKKWLTKKHLFEFYRFNRKDKKSIIVFKIFLYLAAVFLFISIIINIVYISMGFQGDREYQEGNLYSASGTFYNAKDLYNKTIYKNYDAYEILNRLDKIEYDRAIAEAENPKEIERIKNSYQSDTSRKYTGRKYNPPKESIWERVKGRDYWVILGLLTITMLFLSILIKSFEIIFHSIAVGIANEVRKKK